MLDFKNIIIFNLIYKVFDLELELTMGEEKTEMQWKWKNNPTIVQTAWAKGKLHKSFFSKKKEKPKTPPPPIVLAAAPSKSSR